MPERVFGHINGYGINSQFDSRADLSRAGLHRPTQAGISGTGTEGADSIVLSGGYEDDQDLGDIIIYTGQGGRDPDTGRQIADQELTRGNLALVRSQLERLPVRVIRGWTHQSPYSPKAGYQYDGLYLVVDHWHEVGRSGYLVWRYRLVRYTPPPAELPAVEEEDKPVERQMQSVARLVRDSTLARSVKQLYDYTCQVCGTRLELPSGPYAEAAHIRPLGRPHDGPDSIDNLLCLCPNHHVLFDQGGFSINDDFTLAGVSGKLFKQANHQISLVNIRYHRDHYGSR